MSSKKNDWVDQLREKLDHYDAPPHSPTENEEIWTAVLSSVRVKKRSSLRPLWVFTSAAGVAAAVLVAWLFFRPVQTLTPSADFQTEASLAPQPIPIELDSTPPVEEPLHTITPEPSPFSSLSVNPDPSPLYALGDYLPLSVRPVHVRTLPPAYLIQHIAQRSAPTRETLPPPSADHRVLLPYGSPQSAQRFSAGRTRTTLLASNLQGTANSINGYASRYVLSPSTDYPPADAVHDRHPTKDEEKSAREVIALFNQAQGTTVSVQRHPPIRIGLSLGYEIFRGLYLESGLLYTRELTDLRHGSESYYTDTRYTDHILGLPLTVRYDLLRSGSWSLHTSGTVLMEKSITSSQQASYRMGDELVPTSATSETIPNDPLRWSLRAAVGVRYAITERVGLFIEPGVTKQLTTLERSYEEVAPRTLYIDGLIGLSLEF